MVVGILAILAVTFVGAYWVASQYRGRVARVVRPTLKAWQVLRLLAIVILAYGLLVSGRPALQFIGVLAVAFVAVYVVVYDPFDRRSAAS